MSGTGVYAEPLSAFRCVGFGSSANGGGMNRLLGNTPSPGAHARSVQSGHQAGRPAHSAPTLGGWILDFHIDETSLSIFIPSDTSSCMITWVPTRVAA